MPHLIVEYSANVEDRIDLDELLNRLHAAAANFDVFPLGGLRTRASGGTIIAWLMAIRTTASSNVTAIIGHGRPLEVRRNVGQGLFKVICDCLDPAFRDSPLAISFNIQEFHPELNYKRNNLHRFVRARATDAKP